MERIAVDLKLLRVAAPDLALTVGRSLAARVLERGAQQVGIIDLAGAILTAELPDDVHVGDRLRLVVRETTTERVLLQIAPPAQTATPGLVPPAAAELHWPGGARLAVLEREGSAAGGRGGEAGEEAGALTLRYEAPALGVVQLSIALDAGGVRAHVELGAGEALALGEREAGRLRAALADATRRPATVTLSARRDPLDVYV